MPNYLALFAHKPKTIFLVDGIGAFLTFLILLMLSIGFSDYFGMPAEILRALSFIALTFAAYSILCFLVLKINWGLFLKTIMVTNLLYCCLTLGLVVHYFPSLTTMGITYFFVEIALIVALVKIESQVLKLDIQK